MIRLRGCAEREACWSEIRANSRRDINVISHGCTALCSPVLLQLSGCAQVVSSRSRGPPAERRILLMNVIYDACLTQTDVPQVYQVC
jgi:hypothetical protein